MREAGRLNSEEQAKSLSDYLLTEGIDNEVERLDDSWVIWIYQEEQLDRAQTELKQFEGDPAAKKYGGRTRKAEALRKEEAEEAEPTEEKLVDIKRHWQEQTRSWRPTTMLLICGSLLVAALTELGEAADPGSVMQTLTIAPYHTVGNLVKWRGLSAVTGGQIWRLVTPIFLHFGFFHLLFNMVVLYWLGNMVESRRGFLKLLLFILLIAVGSNLGQYLASGPSFGGMSGVAYGLLGYAYLKGRYEPQLGLMVNRNTMILMIGWLLMGFTGMLNFANGAHLIGLLMGVVIGGGPIVYKNLRQ